MNRSSRNPNYWLCQIIGWTVYVLLGLVFVLIYETGPPFWKFLIVYAIAGMLAIAATHLYRGFLQKRGWVRLPPMRALPRVLAASAVLGTAITIIDAFCYIPVFGYHTVAKGGFQWVFPALYSWIGSVFGWNVIYFTLHYFQQYREADVEKLRLAVAAKDAELHALLMQLNPHFMFNCLNSVRALIAEDPERATIMVTELSEFLRYSIRAGRRATVPLAAEMEAVSAYLKLEAIRFEERLHVEMEAAPDALRASVPTMLVQTLVENGVKHGIARLPAGGTIRIHAALEDGMLRVEVSNSGQLSTAASSTQVGLDNARERLRRLYGPNASLALRNEDAQTVVAEVRLPIPGGSAADA